MKLAIKLLNKNVVNKEDYKEEYNKVSSTYTHWLDKMGQFTDRIIDEDIHINRKVKILDFSCGTGYITKKLLEKDIYGEMEIISVDYSDKMLEELRRLEDNRITIVNSEGIEFLRSTDERFDMIYFGWALSYFNYRELFELFKKVLNPKGRVKIITNVQGTLSGIEDIFLKVMYKNQGQVIKPMDIKFNLPNGQEGLTKWFNQFGFQELNVEEEELVVSFDKPEELLDWLSETGAIAGTACIFKDYHLIKEDIIEEIRRTKYKRGKYQINHKFAYGTYRLE
ncbi:MAG TPA: class I SAM-dependent methyltransferase [Eubacteriaceae bacterium]|nr:class I SAM-dependent methyltransferase [Eubacteriaceae bacterium]